MNRVEQSLQRTIVDGLRAALPSNWLIVHYPAGGYRRPVEAAIFKGMGAISGFPDLMIFGEAEWGAAAYFLEVKAGNGAVTDAQHICHEQLRNLGFGVAVVRSWEELLTTCKQWRLPLRLAGLS